jgi:hypothetical protein
VRGIDAAEKRILFPDFRIRSLKSRSLKSRISMSSVRFYSFALITTMTFQQNRRLYMSKAELEERYLVLRLVVLKKSCAFIVQSQVVGRHGRLVDSSAQSGR